MINNILRNDDVAAFILSSVLKINFSKPYFGCAMFNARGFPVGAFLFNNWSGPNVELTIACDVPLGMKAVRFIARAAFVELAASRITVHTSPDNARSLAAIKSVGFQYEGFCSDFYGEGKDAFSFALTRRQQRIIRIKK